MLVLQSDVKCQVVLFVHKEVAALTFLDSHS